MAATTEKPVRIFQEIELSFTENLIPVQIPVKQFDNQARKVRCRLYQNSVEYVVQEGTIVSYSGTRPDGAVFQYSSESRPELVFVDSGTIILTVTSFMTEVYGRFPIDIYLLSDDGDVLGMFNLTLNVARAAITNRKIATLTYKQCVDATMSGIQGFYISEDGYLVMESDDELGLMKGSYSSTMEKVAADVYDKMVNSSIDGNGYLNIDAISGGEGKFITRGRAIDIRWEKDSPWGITHYYDGNEQEIRLNPGTTWVEIVQNDRIDSVTYQ